MMKSFKNNYRVATSCRQGFTLIEITVVIVMLAIIAALALPNLQSQDDLTLSAAARIIVADLLFAQSQAIATGAPQYVGFIPAAVNGGDGSYSLYSDSTLNQPIENPISRQPYKTAFGTGGAGPLASVGLTSLNFFDPSNTVLVFNSLGVPGVCPMTNTAAPTALTGDASLQVGCGSMSITVTVEPNTGNITVSPVSTH